MPSTQWTQRQQAWTMFLLAFSTSSSLYICTSLAELSLIYDNTFSVIEQEFHEFSDMPVYVVSVMYIERLGDEIIYISAETLVVHIKHCDGSKSSKLRHSVPCITMLEVTCLYRYLLVSAQIHN